MQTLRSTLAKALLLGGLSLALPAQAQPDTQPIAAEMAPRAVSSLLTAITPVGDQRLVVIGAHGDILLSDDAGKSWRQVEVPVNSLLTAVSFVDAQTGWAVGHDAVILKTTDGGQSWALLQFEPEQDALLDVMFTDAENGFAIGAYGKLMRSHDGGTSWEDMENEITDEGLHLNKLTRLNDGRLLLVGEAGLIAVSSDGGETWQRSELDYEGSLFAIQPHGAHGALIAGLRGHVFVSSNAGHADWKPFDVAEEQSIFSIRPYQQGYLMVGLNSSAQRIDARGKITTLTLTPQADEAAPAQSREDAAFADVLVLNDRIITVGDEGVRHWAVR
ncbi:YCF48-related protein [Sinimarinibacterium sp. NLF-5-8]|uniref:WD40/YVTN/BNR-like repeat-containing protein n=1 Tax=Sinimarinibacterium sp. NLF-5-8 TaxID=2698684 RepID=UPI00137BB5AD|nr:YCF48-related protein [Sinimarinibacterium sp. NLF-5-8]QHS10452.1 hypothetical protein GT972_10135 [Sinimarinibacterium sp. NLF-5-8]